MGYCQKCLSVTPCNKGLQVKGKPLTVSRTTEADGVLYGWHASDEAFTFTSFSFRKQRLFHVAFYLECLVLYYISLLSIPVMVLVFSTPVDVLASCCKHFLYQDYPHKYPSHPLDRAHPYCDDCLAAQALDSLSLEVRQDTSQDEYPIRTALALSSNSVSDSQAPETTNPASQNTAGPTDCEMSNVQNSLTNCSMQDYTLIGSVVDKVREIKRESGKRPRSAAVCNALGKVGIAIQLWDHWESKRDAMIADILYAFGVEELHEVLHILDCSGLEFMAEYFR